MTQPVAIIGRGCTRFGELPDVSLTSLLAQAAEQAITSAPIAADEIDAIVVGNMLAGQLIEQSHLGAMVASELGVQCPAWRVEAACASGGVAVHQAVSLLQCDHYRNILVLGAEKMTDNPRNDVLSSLMQATSREEQLSGIAFSGLYGLIAQLYLERYQLDPHCFDASMALMHSNTQSYPELAQFPRAVSEQAVRQSPLVADPLRLLHCAPLSDGAAAVLLSTQHAAPTQIVQTAMATDSFGLSGRSDPLASSATVRAFAQLETPISQVRAAELHDCFAVALHVAIEALGIAQRGTSGEYCARQLAGDDVPIIVNPSGGLKAFGHPVGATGVRQIVTMSEYLEQSGGGQGLTHNVGGTGETAVLTLLQSQ